MPEMNNSQRRDLLSKIREEIGNTPLHELTDEHINPHKQNASILIKLEDTNPTKSIKDRMVAYLIDKYLQEGDDEITFLAASSGNTGTSLAYICAQLDLRCIIVTTTKCSAEKLSSCEAHGAEVILVEESHSRQSQDHYEIVASRIADSNPSIININQYDNRLNPQSYYEGLGPEIWSQTNGRVSHFVASGSTCGTITGVAKYLKEKNPEIRVTLADPYGSSIASKLGYASRQSWAKKSVLEGVGKIYMPPLLEAGLIDDVVRVADAAAIDACHSLVRYEDLFLGGSSGLNICAAREIAEGISSEASVVVTIGCDSGEKYTSKIYDSKWLNNLGLDLKC